jgi:hypothetical protein
MVKVFISPNDVQDTNRLSETRLEQRSRTPRKSFLKSSFAIRERWWKALYSKLYRTLWEVCAVVKIAPSMCAERAARNTVTVLQRIKEYSLMPGTIPNSISIWSQIDLSPFEWNFDLDKSGQKFHHSLKERHKISNIPKFRREML